MTSFTCKDIITDWIRIKIVELFFLLTLHMLDVLSNVRTSQQYSKIELGITLTTKTGMLMLTNSSKQTQQGGGFQPKSNTLQNSRAIYYKILNFFEEGVEKFRQNKILQKIV